MRDRNQSYQQFHIQLERLILRNFLRFENRRISFSQELSFEFRPCSLHREVRFRVPRNYRFLRVLSIVQWYFPENLHFLVYLHLSEQEFSWLSEKQRIEIKIFLDSRDSMEKYLYLTERYTGNELFGNILGNDLRDLHRNFKLTRTYYPVPTEKVYRRGPKDKGSRRLDSSISIIEEEIRKDQFILLEEKKRQRHQNYLQSTIKRILINIQNSVD